MPKQYTHVSRFATRQRKRCPRKVFFISQSKEKREKKNKKEVADVNVNRVDDWKTFDVTLCRPIQCDYSVNDFQTKHYSSRNLVPMTDSSFLLENWVSFTKPLIKYARYYWLCFSYYCSSNTRLKSHSR